MERNIFTVDETAIILNSNMEYLRQRRRRGELTGYRKDGRWWFVREDIEIYAKARGITPDWSAIGGELDKLING